jgi:uncharacterized membrane protein
MGIASLRSAVSQTLQASVQEAAITQAATKAAEVTVKQRATRVARALATLRLFMEM